MVVYKTFIPTTAKLSDTKIYNRIASLVYFSNFFGHIYGVLFFSFGNLPEDVRKTAEAFRRLNL